MIKLLHRRSEDGGENICFLADDSGLDELASKLQSQQDEDDNEDGDNDETKADDAEPNPTSTASTAPIIAEGAGPDGSRLERGGVLKSRP